MGQKVKKSARNRPPRYITITSGRSPGSRVISNLRGVSLFME